MSLLRIRPYSHIGLHITDTTIRLVRLCYKKTGFRLLTIAARDLAPGIVVDGNIIQLERLQNILQAIVKQNRVLTVATSLAIPSETVVRRDISIPGLLNEREIYDHIYLNRGQYFPDIAECCFDFTWQQNNTVDHTKVAAIAMSKATLQPWQELVAGSGLHLVAVDIVGHAIATALQFCPDKSKTNAVIYIGDECIDCAVVKNEELISCHACNYCEWSNVPRQMQDFIAEPKIDCLFISGKSGDLSDEITALATASNVDVKTRGPLRWLGISDKYFAEFLVCCGLAVRRDRHACL